MKAKKKDFREVFCSYLLTYIGHFKNGRHIQKGRIRMSEMPQYIEKCRVSWKNKIKKGSFFRKTLLSVMAKTLQDAILDASVNQKYVF